MTKLLTSVTTFLSDNPSENAIVSCFHEIDPLFFSVDKAQLVDFFFECRKVLSVQLKDFNETVYEPLGFHGFKASDVATYFSDVHRFSCNLNKDKAKGVLYGLDHARGRRYIVNGLSRELRLRLLLPKLREVTVFDDEKSPLFFGVGKSDTYLLSQITDITDIGMGHSVYLVSLPNAQWVVKKRENNHQQFYASLLRLFNQTTLYSYTYEYKDSYWEISEFLGYENLGDLFQSVHGISTDIVSQLAFHAALGDLLGRGDRHFENYVLSGEHIVPVDVSYLFWPDNEAWVARYIAGGMAEFSVIIKFIDDLDVLLKQVQIFFDEYNKAICFLVEQQQLIYDHIQCFYPPKLVATYSDYVLDRMKDADYVNKQKMLYLNSFYQYLIRMSYKRLLFKVCDQETLLTETNPLLKMYYYADKERISAFFLLDYFERKSLFQDVLTYALERFPELAEDYHQLQKRYIAIKNLLAKDKGYSRAEDVAFVVEKGLVKKKSLST